MGEVTRDWRSIPISEIFPAEKKDGDDSLLPVRKQIENFESKARLNFNKQRPAPPPPGTQIHLPKIGNYQPKILLNSKNDISKDVTTPTNKETESKKNFEYQPIKRHNSNHDRSNDYVTSEKSKLIERSINDIEIEEKSPTAKKYMIIGDKDIPMTIQTSSDIGSPRQNSDNYFSRFGSDNPVYEPEQHFNTTHSPVESSVMLDFDKTVKNPLFEESAREADMFNEPSIQSADINGGVKNNPLFSESEKENVMFQEPSVQNYDFDDSVKNNPLFNEHVQNDDSNDPGQTMEFFSTEQPGSDVETSPRRSTKKRAAPQPPLNPSLQSVEESTGEKYPYIPAPDYDEDEVTMDFDNSNSPSRSNHYVKRSHSTHSAQRNSIYQDFEAEGDDFSKYLKDDDDYISDHTHTWRRNIRFRQKNSQKPRPISQPNGKAKHHVSDRDKKNGHLKPIGKIKHEHKQENVRRNTIRDFSFSDSKIGLGDRSVRSTTAKGRYIKRSKERSRLDEAEGSYEEFLRLRQVGNGSTDNADIDYDTSDEFLQSEVFARSQPKNVKEGKGTLWQRLTWKFRRTNNGVYQMG